MVVQPSEAEKYNIFTEEVRKFKPMAKTWEFLDLKMLPNITYPPSYDDYHRLCWEFLDREACQKARDALLGRAQPANAVEPGKPKPKPSNQAGPDHLQSGAAATNARPQAPNSATGQR